MKNVTKQKIGIVVGEDVDLPEEFLLKNNCIEYFYKLDWPDVITKREDLYSKMLDQKSKGIKSTPKTSQPPIGELKEVFEKALENFDSIVVLCISSKLSGCYNAAVQARNLLKNKENVYLIESSSASACSAFILLRLLELLEKETSMEVLLEESNNLMQNIHLYGMIEDSYWLQAGGRISPAIGMLVNQMKKIGIRPLFTAKDGKISLLNVRTNAKEKAEALFSYIDTTFGQKQAEVIINYTSDKSEAEKLEKLIKNSKNLKILSVNKMSPVLGAHVGPGALLIGVKL
jgi:DegV family protein with EDD domain